MQEGMISLRMRQQIIWAIILGWPKCLFGFFSPYCHKEKPKQVSGQFNIMYLMRKLKHLGFAHGCKVRFCFRLSESTACTLSSCYVSTTASNIHLHPSGWTELLVVKKRRQWLLHPVSGCLPCNASFRAISRSPWGPRFLRCVQYCNFEVEIDCLFSCVV